MALSAIWFILIFYKSLIVVELLRYDVNVSKQAIDALLPKNPSVFHQYLTSSLIVLSSNNMDKNVINDGQYSNEHVKSMFNDNWKRLGHYHWTDLFSFYNINLNNR